MIGIVVDSNSQMPPALAARYGIDIVPLTVTIDGVDYQEGVDLTAESFYEVWADGHLPEITTSQPSPGAFVAAYTRLAAAGATEILSVHVTHSMSGTINAARIAADAVPVPVRIVDSATASFGVTCCAWAAAESIAGGADLATAAAIAAERAATVATTFVVGIPALTERSGRADGAGVAEAAAAGMPILAMAGGQVEVLDTVAKVEEAVSVMVDYAHHQHPSHADGLRIAVGTSDASSHRAGDALTAALTDDPAVAEIVAYTIGPSVGAHTGPGTAGLFVF